jgi:DNA-binding CsgD family transcriptional regulator
MDAMARKYRVTARQLDVLQAISNGLSEKQVAAELWLSPQTVKFHLKAARRRMDALNTTHAVALAIREGLID